MSNSLVTSDTHFTDKFVLKWNTRPFKDLNEYTEYVIAKWNNVVKKRDVVHHLGDFTFTDLEQAISIMARLNGKIKFLSGNHDEMKIMTQILTIFPEKFSLLPSLYEYKGCWLSHHPIHPTELYGKRNIHGHTHKNHMEIDGGIVGVEDDHRYINACLEHWDHEPVLFEEIKNKKFGPTIIFKKERLKNNENKLTDGGH